MALGYRIVQLSDAEQLMRRTSLDRFANYAQLSAALPPLAYILYRLIQWHRKPTRRMTNKDYSNVTTESSDLKESTIVPFWTQEVSSWSIAWRRLYWWLGDEVVFANEAWGRRDEWLYGAFWCSWLLVLCIWGTGNDYLHLTSRFGIIAASQYPLQYLLAMRSTGPLTWAFRSSHEQLNRFHKVLGRVINLLVLFHVIFYLSFFQQEGILLQRLVTPTVALGVVSYVGLNAMSLTALRTIREFSYRIFIITHLIIALLMPPLLFLHTKHASRFFLEALAIYLVDLVLRRKTTFVTEASLMPVSDSNLIKISVVVPLEKSSPAEWRAGSHVYLAMPTLAASIQTPFAAAKSRVLYDTIANPFSAADNDDGVSSLTLVVRRHNGPLTSTLERLARTGPCGSNTGLVESLTAPIRVEGPYGSAKYFPDFSEDSFDKVLLIAGGVGATFILPLYRSILRENSNVDMVWAARSPADTDWMTMDGSLEKDVFDTKTMRIFHTRTPCGQVSPSQARNTDMIPENHDPHSSPESRNRPDLKGIVDAAFETSVGPKVAVIVCGPGEMAREIRMHVGFWVRKGWSVWWHNEHFSQHLS